MNKSNKAYLMALLGVMFAVIIVAMLLDRLVSLALPVSMALLVLLVTNCCIMMYNSWLLAIMAGLFMGLASMLKDVMLGAPTLIYNINPLVSVLPRVAMAVSAFGVYRLCLAVAKQASAKAHVVSMTIAVLVGLMVNTALYLTALNMYKEYLGDDYTGLLVIVKAVLYTNILPEYLLSIVATPIIVMRVRRAMHLGLDGRQVAEEIL